MPDSAVIALDAMGGDFGPDVVVPAATKILSRRNQLHIILVGDEERVEARRFGDGLKLRVARQILLWQRLLPARATRHRLGLLLCQVGALRRLLALHGALVML